MAGERLNPSIQEVLDIAHGGTGASTAAEARTNLEITPENIGAVTADDVTKAVSNRAYVKVTDTRGTDSVTIHLNTDNRYAIFIAIIPNDIVSNRTRAVSGVVFLGGGVGEGRIISTVPNTQFSYGEGYITFSGLGPYWGITAIGPYEMT